MNHPLLVALLTVALADVAFFFLMIRRRPRSPLFPYTTLFRSLRRRTAPRSPPHASISAGCPRFSGALRRDRKSTRLNSSHSQISYAVSCWKKKSEEIQRECDAIGSIPVGYAAITTGGKLKARFVIHAASMQLGGKTSADSLRHS